jgi:hypothetical protein
VLIALVALGGWALLHHTGLHRTGAPAAAPTKQAPLRPRSAIAVLVLNGDGMNGSAGAVANRLLADRYREASPTDAQVTTYARSLVLFRRGWAGEAERLGRDLHIRAVAALDGPVPPGGARYPLVVIVGH